MSIFGFDQYSTFSATCNKVALGIPFAKHQPRLEGLVLSPSGVNAVWKLANAGERAGLSLEQMIELLNSGMSVVALLDLITWRLDYPETSPE